MRSVTPDRTGKHAADAELNELRSQAAAMLEQPDD